MTANGNNDYIWCGSSDQVINVGEIEGAIQNGQSRNTGKSAHTRRKLKINNKTQTYIIDKKSGTDHTKKLWANPDARKG